MAIHARCIQGWSYAAGVVVSLGAPLVMLGLESGRTCNWLVSRFAVPGIRHAFVRTFSATGAQFARLFEWGSGLQQVAGRQELPSRGHVQRSNWCSATFGWVKRLHCPFHGSRLGIHAFPARAHCDVGVYVD